MAYKYKTESENETHCLECGSVLYGRTDKKYCDASCRNRHFKRQERACKSQTAHTATALERNHTILEEMLRLGITSIRLSEMEALGFRPEVCSGWIKKGRGAGMRLCYDLEYSQSELKVFRLHRRETGGEG